MGINKDSQKVPNLRFKGFTDDWEQRKLGSIYQFQYGQFNNNPDNGGIYPIYGANGIIGGYHGYNADNSVVIGHMGAYAGHVLWAEGKHFVTYNGTIGFPKDLNFDRKFGFHMLQHINIPKITAGSGQPFVSYADLKNIKVHISDSIDEQNKLGNFFDMLENTITLHQRKLEQLNQLKEALLQQMFPGKGETVPKLRFAGFEGDWEERKLGEISKIKTGSSDLQDADATGNYPFFVRSENIERSNRFLFEGEAILIPGEGRLGEIYHYINGKFDYHQRVYKISNFSDYNVQGLFVLYYLKNNFKRHALKYTVKATVDSLRLPTLLEFNIMVPNLIEQEKIGNFLNCIENTITLQQRKLEQLQNMKQALLQNMFI